MIGFRVSANRTGKHDDDVRCCCAAGPGSPFDDGRHLYGIPHSYLVTAICGACRKVGFGECAVYGMTNFLFMWQALYRRSPVDPNALIIMLDLHVCGRSTC